MTQATSGEINVWSGSLTVVAAGVYDPEKQLNPEQIIELKQRFTQEYNLGPYVCAHIALGHILQREAGYDAAMQRVAARESIAYGSTFKPFETREDFALEVASLAAHWSRALAHILSLPGAEWPEGFSPPATFAEAIKELEAEEGSENG